METEGILNRKVDKAAQQPSHSQENDPHQGTLMVNRMEGLFVEKPLHDDKKEPKRGPLRRAAKAARTAEREEREAETAARAARAERAERAEAAPTGHKKTGRPHPHGTFRPEFISAVTARLLAQQLFYFGGLRKIVAAEASVHHVPRQRDGPPTCPRAASPRQPPKNRCRRSIGASRPSAKRRTDYLPSNCFTSAATVTPL